MTAVKVVVALFVVLLAVATVLRVRKLRRDEMRELSKPAERRLMTPPPSPYAPSKGFRLLDSSGEPLERPPVARPRLDPERRYVFGETGGGEEIAPPHVRHGDDWLLSRSLRRPTLGTWVVRLLVALVIVVAIAVVVTYYLDQHPKTTPKGSSAPRLLSTTTTSALPSIFRPASIQGEDAYYDVAAASFRVSVVGARGTTWATFEMGPANTLEWQGDVTSGGTESLTLRGDARVTLGSPSSAAVSVDGRTVVFPSPLPSTLTVVFSSTAG